MVMGHTKDFMHLEGWKNIYRLKKTYKKWQHTKIVSIKLFKDTLLKNTPLPNCGDSALCSLVCRQGEEQTGDTCLSHYCYTHFTAHLCFRQGQLKWCQPSSSQYCHTETTKDYLHSIYIKPGNVFIQILSKPKWFSLKLRYLLPSELELNVQHISTVQ